MSADRLKQIAIALAILVFLWGAVEMLRGGFDEATTDFEIPAVAMEDADTVVFERTQDTIVLARHGDDWTVNGNRASSSRVSDFFGVLEDASPGQLIAQNAETHRRLAIGDSTARVFRILGKGRTLAHLLLGKRAPGFRDTYFRRPGEDRVYAVRTTLSTYVDRGLQDWRDRTIARIDAEGVASAEIHLGGRSYVLRREGDKWQLPGGEATDSAAVARLLDEYESLDATGFRRPEEEVSVDFDRPDRLVALRDAAGATLLELAFDSTAGGFWVRKTGDSTVFRISNFVANRIAPTDSTLREDGR